MGDLERGAASQGQPGTAGNASPEGATEGAAPKPVTLEQVQDLLSKATTNLRSEVGKQIQSQIDKADVRISDRLRQEFVNIDNYAKLAKDAGQEVSPETIKRMKQDAMMREFEGEQVQGQGSGGGSAQGQQQGQSQQQIQQSPVVMTALALMQEEGVFIEDTDPEVKLIDLKTTSPKALLASVQGAIEAKKQRLSGASNEQNQTEQEGDAAKAAARNPGKGASAGKPVVGSSPDGLTSMAYFKRAYNKPK